MENREIYKESISKLLIETDNIVFEIRSLRRDNQKLTAENDKNIAHLQEKLLEAEATMKEKLTRSGEDVIKPKCGWAHFKALKDKIIIKDVAKTIEEIRKKLPDFVDSLIKYVETYSIRKDNLNALVKEGKVKIADFDTIYLEPQGKKFEYKYTGE